MNVLKVSLVVMIIGVVSANAQDSTLFKLNQRLDQLSEDNCNLQLQIRKQKVQMTNFRQSIKNSVQQSLQQQRKRTDSSVARIADSVNKAFTSIVSMHSESQSRFRTMEEMLGDRTLSFIIASLALLLLSVVIFISLRSKVTANIQELYRYVGVTREEIESKVMKNEEQLLEQLKAQVLAFQGGKKPLAQKLSAGTLSLPFPEESPVQCQGTTQNGKRCTRMALPGKQFCKQHSRK